MNKEQQENELRESIVHGLRSRGWSRIEAEDEADNRIERWRQQRKLQERSYEV